MPRWIPVLGYVAAKTLITLRWVPIASVSAPIQMLISILREYVNAKMSGQALTLEPVFVGVTIPTRKF